MFPMPNSNFELRRFFCASRRRSAAAMFLLFPALFLAAPLFAAADFRTVESRSGQFLIRCREPFSPPPLLEDEKAAGLITLTPELAAISAERIKENLLQLLGAPDRWRGKIRLHFRPGKSNPDLFQVRSARFSNGWTYQVAISAKIRRQVWLRNCVALLLLEIGNRLAGERSVEIPFWLIDGIATELRHSALLDLSPSHAERLRLGAPDSNSVFPNQLYQDALLSTRRWLSQNPPASAAELFFPEDQHWRGRKNPLFAHSAHLFLRRLLDLRAGKASLRQFLSALPTRLNWQQAFFPSFQPHFQKMLDLEKWWAVILSDFLTNPYSAPIDPQKFEIGSRPPEETLAQLEQLFSLPALVGRKRDEIAQRERFSLQQAIAQWDYADQKSALEPIVNRLSILAIYAHPQLAPLLRDYQKTLRNYLSKRDQAGRQSSAKRPLQMRRRPQRIAQKTQQKLNQLDDQRRQLSNPTPANPPQTKESQTPNSSKQTKTLPPQL